METLNSLVPSIKFKLEIEQNRSLPFLDTVIMRTENGFKFKVYRKPTSVNAFIHNFSNHHNKIKRSVFSNMFLRAFKICDPEFLENEFQTIFDIAQELCYPRDFIENCLRNARKTYFRDERINSFDFDNIFVLPYRQEFLTIVNSLKCLKINVIFSNNMSIKNSLFCNKPTSEKGGVYRINCSVCNIPYIGQSGKGLCKRVSQHKYNVRTANNNSAIFCHVRDFNHPIDWQSAKIVFQTSSLQNRLLVEGSLIASLDNMNLSDGLFKIDELLKCFILKQSNVKRALKYFNNR